MARVINTKRSFKWFAKKSIWVIFHSGCLAYLKVRWTVGTAPKPVWRQPQSALLIQSGIVWYYLLCSSTVYHSKLFCHFGSVIYHKIVLSALGRMARSNHFAVYTGNRLNWGRLCFYTSGLGHVCIYYYTSQMVGLKPSPSTNRKKRKKKIRRHFLAIFNVC